MGMKLIFLGAPGAGKGTQAEILSAKLGIPTISTGNILRAAIQAGTQVGLEAKSYMDAGRLVPDSVIIAIVAQQLEQPGFANGFILDGVPRTIGQAEALDAAGITFDHVISIEISDQEIVDRMAGRRVCSACGAPYHVKSKPPQSDGVCDSCGGPVIQRDDDKPETVLHRLEVYHAETEPLKEYYAAKGILVPVENQPTIEATTQVMMEALGI
jgi:adenylate kinase